MLKEASHSLFKLDIGEIDAQAFLSRLCEMNGDS